MRKCRLSIVTFPPDQDSAFSRPGGNGRRGKLNLGAAAGHADANGTASADV